MAAPHFDAGVQDGDWVALGTAPPGSPRVRIEGAKIEQVELEYKGAILHVFSARAQSDLGSEVAKAFEPYGTPGIAHEACQAENGGTNETS
jgi:hypothetical protein